MSGSEPVTPLCVTIKLFPVINLILKSFGPLFRSVVYSIQYYYYFLTSGGKKYKKFNFMISFAKYVNSW